MSEATGDRTTYTFGPFEADLKTEELRRKGLPVRIPSQSFQVLRLLLSRPGELVSRTELQHALWPDDAFGDFEHGLNAAVNRLRDALGDSADSPHFVETLPRRGYRFIAALEPPFPDAPDQQPVGRPEEISREGGRDSRIPSPRLSWASAARLLLDRRNRGAASFALAALAVVAICFAGVQRWRWTHPSSPEATHPSHNYAAVQVETLTALTGMEYGPTFSPDGSQVAFSWDGGNPDATHPYDLYVKVVGSEHVEQITHNLADWIIAAWSPDGRNVAFLRKGPNNSGIFTVSPLGGPERKLADVSLRYTYPMSLSWSPDGRSLAYATGEFFGTVSVEDGAVHPLPRPPECIATTPAFSPDGRWIAFSCYRDGGYDLDVMTTTGSGFAKLTRVYELASPITWTADSTRVLYTNHSRLFAISREGGQPEQLTFAFAAYHPAVSLRGDRLAYAEWTRNINLWRIDLVPPKAGRTASLITTSRIQQAPDVSSDGKKIAFESERLGRHDVWVSNLDGSEAVEMGNFLTLTGSPRWSPDSRLVVFDSRESGRASLYLADPQEAVPRRIDTNGVDAQVPRWSRDGKWIYFTTVSNGTFGGLFKVAPSGGKPQIVVATQAVNAQEDRAGQTLYFMAGETNAAIHALDLSTGTQHTIEGMPAVDTPTDWVLASNGIYFIDPTAKPASLNFFDFASHRVSRRMPLPKPPEVWGGLALAPDESWAVYCQVDRNDSDLMLAEPFR